MLFSIQNSAHARQPRGLSHGFPTLLRGRATRHDRFYGGVEGWDGRMGSSKARGGPECVAGHSIECVAEAALPGFDTMV